METLTLKILKETGADIDPTNVEDCHWINTKGPKKATIKFSRRMHVNKVRMAKNKWKVNTFALRDLKVRYSNVSLCTYYKKFLAKYKKLHTNNSIHAFWESNGSIKLKVSPILNVHAVAHDACGRTTNIESIFI